MRTTLMQHRKLFVLASSLLLLGGCATNSDMDGLKAEIAKASAAASRAQQSADSANATAKQALATANQAQNTGNQGVKEAQAAHTVANGAAQKAEAAQKDVARLDEKMDQMFKKVQRK